jgi:hypothetical protein
MLITYWVGISVLRLVFVMYNWKGTEAVLSEGASVLFITAFYFS